MGTLYLVATPIGNLGDISQRALEVLTNCDFIAAEDTRVTLKLLNRFDIKKPLVSYYEHNRTTSGARILERLLSGESCALVSDAGTPIISDPGFDLVSLCAQAGVEVVSLPGPCAAITALTLSALPAGRFCFEGFLSTNKKDRREHLEQLKYEPRTMVFYEAPHKLLYTLRDLLEVLGNRRISLCRELTKLHEQVWRTTLAEAAEYYQQNPPRGEFVLVIQGTMQPAPEADSLTFEEAVALVQTLHQGGLRLKDAVKQAAEQTGHNKNDLYRAALAHAEQDN